MIKINKFPQQKVKLYNADNVLIAVLNNAELLDVQCQICENNLDGYYIILPSGLKVDIDVFGETTDWDETTFKDELNNTLRLRRIQKDKFDDVDVISMMRDKMNEEFKNMHKNED